LREWSGKSIPATTTTTAAATFVAATTAFVAAATATTITAATVTAATAAATISAATAVATTTTAATAFAAVTTAAATWTTAAGLKFFGLRGVYAKFAALIVETIESFDGSVQLALVAERHESESLGSACLAVGDDFDPFNRSISGEESSNVFFSSGVGQVAHVDVHFSRFLKHAITFNTS
jgi:hypothetical protein